MGYTYSAEVVVACLKFKCKLAVWVLSGSSAQEGQRAQTEPAGTWKLPPLLWDPRPPTAPRAAARFHMAPLPCLAGPVFTDVSEESKLRFTSP